jgi:hypothetical protein
VPALVEQQAKGTAARGVGRFLAIHENCGAGFEITRNGRGKLHLLCGACGERTQYGAADTEQLRAHGVDPEQAVRARRFHPRREAVERWLPAPAALPWWVPNAYIFAVILIGLGMIAFGILRPGSEDLPVLGGADQEEQSPPATEEPTPEPEAPVTAPEAPVTAGAGPAPAPKPAPAERPAPAPDLQRIEVLGRFAVGVPSSWDGGTGDGAVVFTAPGAGAVLRVFLEPGGAKPGSLSDEATRFLREEHPEAKITRPAPRRLGKFRGVEILATYPGGEERATLLSANGYSYLLLSSVDGGAPAAVRAASVAALRSFRPL